MKGWLLLVAAFLLWPGCSSQDACEEPEDVDFGEIVSTERAKYLENDQVQYKCNLGYVLEGPEWIQCKGQKWTPRPPKCLAPCSITRQQLATKNLFVFGSQRKARLVQSNQSLQFLCDEGYVLAVPSVRKCVDGYIELPLCISGGGKNCSGPPRIENGDIMTLSAKQYRSGSSVEFRCQSHYAMEGQKRSFCDNGAWTKAPICLDPCVIPRTELESQKITEVENGTEVKNGTDVPENIFVQRGLSIELTCRTGYVLAENSSQSAFVMHCDGTPPVIPKCKEITCNSPRISDGSFRPQRTVYHDGDLIRIRCDSGFTFEPVNGDQVVECTKNGWSPSPKCVTVGHTCKNLPLTNGYFESEQRIFQMNANAKYSCGYGYTTSQGETEAETQCLSGGWSPEPECIKTCLKPPEGDFIFNTTKPVFFPGDKLHYECKEGFQTTKNTIDETVACTEKGWESTPSCNPITCDAPFLENGRIDPREDTFYHGMVVHFGCNEGFTRVGPESAQCYQFGWSPQLPICKENVVSCPVSPIISHGKIIGEPKPTYQHGDLLEVQCDISFALYGSKIIECVDGEWAPLPSCIEESKTCRRPPPIRNGQLANTKSSPYRHGETVTYKCRKPTVLIGTNPAKCLHGQWDVPSCLVNPRDCTRPQTDAVFQPTTNQFQTNQFANYRCGSKVHQTNCVNGLWFPEPRCKGTCPPPPQLPNAINVAEMRIYRSEEEISFKCQEHFLLHGPQKIKCDDGKWQTPPRCLDLRCKPPPEIENGITVIENGAMFPPGEIVEYRCSLGFEISQLNTVKCENGKWSELPVCREKSCGPAPGIPNASLQQENREEYDSGTIINYTCNPGFEAKESAKKTCRRGEWVGAFTCKDIRCSSPPEIEHARIMGVRKAKYLTGDKMKYQCNPGYVLLGNSFITCLKEGWREIPRCTDIEGKCGRPPPVENGDVVNTPKLFYLQSESVTYQCQNFYTMEGSPRVTCQNGRWSQTPTCRVACTASEEDMTQRNIRLKWPNGDTLYSMDGGVVEFICLRGYKPHPTSGPFRIHCVEGKFDYPHCIRYN